MLLVLRSSASLIRAEPSLFLREPATLPGVALTEHLRVVLAEETEGVLSPLSREALAARGEDEADALAAAREALGRRADAWVEAAPGVWAAPADDPCGGARLLLPDAIGALPLRGAPVAVAPVTGRLLVAGSDDPEALAALASLASEAVTEAKRTARQDEIVSGVALRPSSAGGWVPFLPDDPADAARAALNRLRQDALMSEYAQLEPVARRAGEAIATLRLGRDGKTGAPTLVAMWEREGQLLPPADHVAVGRGGGAWHRVLEVLGSRLEPLGTHPPLWRAGALPSADEHAALRARARRRGRTSDPS